MSDFNFEAAERALNNVVPQTKSKSASDDAIARAEEAYQESIKSHKNSIDRYNNAQKKVVVKEQPIQATSLGTYTKESAIANVLHLKNPPREFSWNIDDIKPYSSSGSKGHSYFSDLDGDVPYQKTNHPPVQLLKTNSTFLYVDSTK